MPIRLQITSTSHELYKVFNAKTGEGKFIQSPKKGGQASLAVLPCRTHDQAVSIPVEVVTRPKDAKEFTVLGTGQACPICWRVLKKDF